MWTFSPKLDALSKRCDELLLTISFQERERRKYARELNNLTVKMDDLQRIDTLQTRVSELFTNMKRLERENQKNKKRGDQLQKEKDNARHDLTKTTSLKEKLEKLCRELQKENNRLKVRWLTRDGCEVD